MYKKHYAFFWAYIAFLCLCVIYRIVCMIFVQQQFALWDRIVTAVTASTWLFCLSDTLKTKENLSEYLTLKFDLLDEKTYSITVHMKDILTEEINSYEQENTSNKDALADEVTKLIKGDDSKKEVNASKKGAYACDIAGFLVLFCVLILSFQYCATI